MPKCGRGPGDSKQVEVVSVDLTVLSEPYILSFEDMIIVLPNMIRNAVSIPRYLCRLPVDTKQKPQWFLMEEAL